MQRVLVVDDNCDLADDLAEILEGEGHCAHVAYGAAEALAVARDFPFDAALVDMRMPGMDGVALVQCLMSEHPSSTYLFMTGDSSDRSLAEAVAISHRAVLYKPLDIGRVLRFLSAPGTA